MRIDPKNPDATADIFIFEKSGTVSLVNSWTKSVYGEYTIPGIGGLSAEYMISGLPRIVPNNIVFHWR